MDKEKAVIQSIVDWVRKQVIVGNLRNRDLIFTKLRTYDELIDFSRRNSLK